jgi:8-oxo-dGTP diphosphatase
MPKKSKKHQYDYPRPALTVDLALITSERKPRVLLIQRGGEPFAGMWALPGGFVEENEPLERAALRELHEETGIEIDDLEQFGAFGDPGRDPRGWTVSVVYRCPVDPKKLKPRAGDDASDVAWHRLDQLPPMAFDHGARSASRSTLTSVIDAVERTSDDIP